MLVAEPDRRWHVRSFSRRTIRRFHSAQPAVEAWGSVFGSASQKHVSGVSG